MLQAAVASCVDRGWWHNCTRRADSHLCPRSCLFLLFAARKGYTRITVRDRNFGVNGAQAQEVSTICLRLLLLRVIRSSDQISLVAPILLRGFQLNRNSSKSQNTSRNCGYFRSFHFRQQIVNHNNFTQT